MELTPEQTENLIKMLPYVIIAFLIIALFNKDKPVETKNEKFWQQHYRNMRLIDRFPYLKQPILTHNQVTSYKKLKEYADNNNLTVFPKVHLRHLLRSDEVMDKAYLDALITPGWVDFVICDAELKPIVIINLESEQTPENDAIKDMIIKMFSGAGYRIMYVPEITDYYLDAIK